MYAMKFRAEKQAVVFCSESYVYGFDTVPVRICNNVLLCS
jgi:hypothetical protein